VKTSTSRQNADQDLCRWSREGFEPFTLTYKDASVYFGFAEETLRHMVSNGELLRGKHYLKVGRKVLILRQGFIEWLLEKDGVNTGGFYGS